MMTIEGMTEQEKSVMLAKALGWEMQVRPTGLVLFRPTPRHGWYSDLYETNPDNDEPRYMHIAWRVLNWAFESLPFQGDFFYAVSTWVQQPPAIAQRQWLDKILALAIETGIVEALESP